MIKTPLHQPRLPLNWDEALKANAPRPEPRRPLRQAPPAHVNDAPREDGLAAAFTQFYISCQAKNLTPASPRFYRQQILPFLAWCREQGIAHLDSVQTQHIRTYLVVSRERGLSDESVCAVYRALRVFFTFSAKERLIHASPMANVDRPRKEFRVLPPLSEQEVITLLETSTSVRDRALILFMVDTGCRAAEALGVTGADIDMDNLTVLVRRGKGRKPRLLPLAPLTRQALLAYFAQCGQPGPDESVWRTETKGTPLTYAGLRQMLRRLGRRAGVKHSHPHTLRRTFAVWSHQNGVSDQDLAKLMGHSSTVVLRHYVSLSDAHLKQVHQRHGPLTNLHAELLEKLEGAEP